MALVKCKECGAKVSNKAKSCPSCGAAVPKSTSAFTWLVLVLIVVGVYSAMQAPPPSTSDTSTSSTTAERTTNSQNQTSTAPPAAPAWRSFTTTDDLTGEESAFATSPRVAATRRMSFPYSGVRGWLGVGCDVSSEWAYASFTEAPNLTNTDTQSGYDVINTRIRFDETVEDITLTQSWGATGLHFADDQAVITKFAESSSVLLELSWYGEDQAIFEFPLNGSTAAISQMRERCESFDQ